MSLEEKPGHKLIVSRVGDGGPTPLQVAHAILEEHNLPYGLLPMESLIECLYNPVDGRFRVTQPVSECDATFGGHKLKFHREISGRLDHNLIRDLKGVKVKAMIIWLPIGAVDTDPKPGKLIHFRAGPFNASLEAQELWEYKFWAPAFHTEVEKEEASAASKTLLAGQLSSLRAKMRSAKVGVEPQVLPTP